MAPILCRNFPKVFQFAGVLDLQHLFPAVFPLKSVVSESLCRDFPLNNIAVLFFSIFPTFSLRCFFPDSCHFASLCYVFFLRQSTGFSHDLLSIVSLICSFLSRRLPFVLVLLQVKVQGQNTELLMAACEQFLGKPENEIRRVALETLEGHQRAIMGSMTVEVSAILLISIIVIGTTAPLLTAR